MLIIRKMLERAGQEGPPTFSHAVHAVAFPPFLSEGFFLQFLSILFSEKHK